MRPIAALLGVLLALTLSRAAAAQGARPFPRPTSPSGSAVDAIERSTTRPIPTVPPVPVAPGAGTVWVPDRQVRVPGVDGNVWVPGHWEQKLSDREYAVPPLIGTTPDGGTVHVPAGTRPPAERRQGP